ncbi:polyamine aminopropyltransferase [Patescibacteria group bacterium]
MNIPESGSINETYWNKLFILCAVALLIFTTGATGFINEYNLAGVTGQILGATFFNFVLSTSSMVAAMGIGSLFQKQVADKYLITILFVVECLLALLGSYAPSIIFATHGLEPEHFKLVLYFMILSIGFLVGFEIPLATRILSIYKVELKLGLGIVLCSDFVGGYFGALIFAFCFLGVIPFTEIGFVGNGINFVIAGLFMLFFILRGEIKNWIAVSVSFVLISIMLLYGYSNNLDWNEFLDQRVYKDPIIASKITRYQKLNLTNNPKTGDTRLYINGNTQFASADEFIYHEILVHPAVSLTKNINNVLILGGGDGLVLRELRKYADIKKITLVDLDPQMIEFASTNPYMREINQGSFDDIRVFARTGGLLFSERGTRPIYEEKIRRFPGHKPEGMVTAEVDVFTVDADSFVGELRDELYNLVIIDFPDPSCPDLAKLYSREFYYKLRTKLAPGARIAIQATSSYYAKESYLMIQRTMEAAGFKTIPYHRTVHSFGEWGFLLAWDSGESVFDLKKQISTIESFPVETRYLTPDVFRASMVFGKGELSNPKNIGINTLMFPILSRVYERDCWKLK